MGGVVKSIGHGISHAFKQVTHGVEHLFGEAGKVWSKITPWDDDTGLGKILNAAALAAIGYWGGSQIGLWGTQEAAGATTAGTLAESGENALSSATASGSVGLGSGLSSVSTGGTAAGVASEGIGLTSSMPTVSQGGLFTSALKTAKDIGSGALNLAKAHPLAAGMIASGALQGIGGYLQGKAMQDMKEKEIEEQKREFNLLHNMGLDTTASKVLSPIEKLRLQQAQQQATTPQELELLLRNYPAQSIETRAGRFRSDTNELVPLLQSYYNRGNIGLFTMPY